MRIISSTQSSVDVAEEEEEEEEEVCKGKRLGTEICFVGAPCPRPAALGRGGSTPANNKAQYSKALRHTQRQRKKEREESEPLFASSEKSLFFVTCHHSQLKRVGIRLVLNHQNKQRNKETPPPLFPDCYPWPKPVLANSKRF